MRYDLCVIGAGSAGVAAAEAARELGKHVVIVTDEGALGGTCILRGCMPAKTLLSSTERLGAVERAATVGIDAGRARVDLARLVARKRELVDYFAEDRIEEIRSFPLVRGRARFVSPDAIDVGGRRLEADGFVIATGSRIDASILPCLQPGEFFTSDDALEMTEAPDRLIVIGGGPVGCEFSQYFARLGSRVTLVQDAPELLRNEDADVGRAVRAALESDGVEVILQASVLGCSRSGETRELHIATPSGEQDLAADGVMLATGRIPNVVELELASAGVELTEAGGIATDPYLRTANHRIFAAGDALGRRCLVHVAVYAGRLAARNACGAPLTAAAFGRFEAHAVYVQPQVAVAGLTERDAAAAGLEIRMRSHPFHELGKAIVSGEPAGFVKMIADGADRIRGVALVGDGVAELAGEAILIVDRGFSLREVAEMPALHPTMSEIFARVAQDFATLPVPLGAPAEASDILEKIA